MTVHGGWPLSGFCWINLFARSISAGSTWQANDCDSVRSRIVEMLKFSDELDKSESFQERTLEDLNFLPRWRGRRRDFEHLLGFCEPQSSDKNMDSPEPVIIVSSWVGQSDKNSSSHKDESVIEECTMSSSKNTSEFS